MPSSSRPFHDPQRKFLLALLPSLLIVCGKANYTNVSRYSNLCERTYRRHYDQGMWLEAINQQLIGRWSFK